ncbi:hypothetical protein F5Y16DRAFT_400418 [Xylariaceae sp. FL0255]|nr:hypothetical protein F5Y16DRAFT_400418 [Xylariaceae sp. FL0255]
MATEDVVMGDTQSISQAQYDRILSWIKQQKQTPKPLSADLQTALLNLHTAILQAEGTPSATEPEIGGTNWISLLGEYQQANRSTSGSIASYEESPIDPTGRALRWLCTVMIGENPGEAFPAGPDKPTFARKKDAKQYAAKGAIEWLRETGRMPKDGGVKFPKGWTQPSMRAAAAVPPPASSAPPPISSATSTSSSSTSSRTSPPPQKLFYSPFDDTQPSATHEVAALLKSLRLPIPIYDLRPSTGHNGAGGEFWSGWANFGVNAATLPFDPSTLIHVEHALGKRAAKEKIAEDLLVHLRAIKAKRDAEIQAFMEKPFEQA